MDYVTLANGKKVSWEDFSTWSSHRQTMSIAPPNKGRKFGEEFGEKISFIRREGFKNGKYSHVRGSDHANSRRVKTPEGEFATLKDAGIYYSVRGSTIRDWIKKGKSGFSFLSPPVVRNAPKKKGGVSGALNNSSRPVITPYGIFCSIKDAAEKIGISTGAVAYRIKQSKNGEYRYASLSANRRSGVSPSKKKIITPEGIFESIADAARHYGITSEGIRYRIKSKFKSEYRVANEDINPSQLHF